jgi:purine nucleosidase
MIDLIYDCDITMGLPGRDVDDGLALLYLLGSPAIRLLGITSTFGNSSVNEVHPCLLSILEDMGRSDIPAHIGASRQAVSPAASPRGRDARADSDAARFLAEAVRESPGTVSVLATGSPTNLLGAYRLHPGFFADTKQIVLMGGITEPLLINGREMGELNFSSDPHAALYTLYGGDPPRAAGCSETSAQPCRPPSAGAAGPTVTVITGNLCLQALLSREHFAAFLEESRGKVAKDFIVYLEEKILPWFSWIEREFRLPGFHAWDATAALYLTGPQLFEAQNMVLRSTLPDLKTGYLRTDEPREPVAGTPACAGTPAAGNAETGNPNPRRINVPIRIRDLSAYWQSLFAGWRAAGAAWPQ